MSFTRHSLTALALLGFAVLGLTAPAPTPRRERERMHPSVVKLTKILPPPTNPVNTGTPAEWSRVEGELGIRFPADYKSFVRTYGSGYVNNCLRLYNPFRPCPEEEETPEFTFYLRNLQDAMARRRLRTGEHSPVWPEPGGFLIAGSTDVGDRLVWHTVGHPDKWPLRVVGERRSWDTEGQYEEFRMGVVEFLYRFLKGEIEPKEPRRMYFELPLRYGPYRVWPDDVDDEQMPQ